MNPNKYCSPRLLWGLCSKHNSKTILFFKAVKPSTTNFIHFAQTDTDIFTLFLFLFQFLKFRSKIRNQNSAHDQRLKSIWRAVQDARRGGGLLTIVYIQSGCKTQCAVKSKKKKNLLNAKTAKGDPWRSEGPLQWGK